MKTKKFNILDAVLIVFALALVVILALKFTGKDMITATGSYTEAEYVITVEQIRDFTVDEIKVGAEICLDEERDIKGIVQNIETEKSKAQIVKSNGSVVLAEKPDRYDAYITVKSEGIQKTDGFYLFGKHAINVGSTRLFRTGYVVFTGTVSEIKS